MTKNHIVSERLPSPGNFSHLVQHGTTVYTSGFGPVDPSTGNQPEGIEAQTAQTIKNVATALQEVGLTLADVVKATVHLGDISRDFDGFNAVYEELFPRPFPARTTVGSHLPGILVEIDVVAMR